MPSRLLALSALLVLGCNQGHEEGEPDLAAPDLAAPSDLATPDLQGPSCGMLFTCVLECGLTNLQCDQMCFTGAQPEALQQATALALCAGTMCLGGLLGDGGLGGLGGGGLGGVNPLEIVQCMEQKCPMQVNGCAGLPFAAPTQ